MSNFLAVQRQMAVSKTADQIISGLNPTVWLAARKETVYANNDPVGTATDWSGNGYHATQSVAASKPLFKTGVLNGLPTFWFDGTDDGLVTPTLPGTIHDGSFTIFCVWRNSATGPRDIYDTDPWNSGSYGGIHLPADTNYSANIRNTAISGQYSAYDIATEWGNDNVWRASSHTCNHTHSSHALYNNGQPATPWISRRTYDPGTTQNNFAMSIGCKNAGSAPQYGILGDIAEWIAFPDALSTADRQALEDALGSTYGITITH